MTTVLLWDVRQGKRKRLLTGYPDGVHAPAFSANSKTLAIGSAYSAVASLKRLDRRGKRTSLMGHRDGLRAVTYSPDGMRLATGAKDGTVRIWEASSGRLLATLLALPKEEWIIYTPEGYYIASPDADQYLLWHDGIDLQPARSFADVFRNPEKVRQALIDRLPRDIESLRHPASR